MSLGPIFQEKIAIVAYYLSLLERSKPRLLKSITVRPSLPHCFFKNGLFQTSQQTLFTAPATCGMISFLAFFYGFAVRFWRGVTHKKVMKRARYRTTFNQVTK